MPKYHFLKGTNVVGPLALTELQKLVQSGVITESTLVFDDSSKWIEANKLVPELFTSEHPKPKSDSPVGAEQWYVKSNGQQYGPISFTELLGWTGTGSVVAGTLVRKSTHGNWQAAEEVFPHLRPKSRAVQKPTTAIAVQVRPTKDDASRTAAKKSVEQPATETEVFAFIGVLTVGLLLAGSVLYYYFVLEPQIKQVIGPLGFLLASIAISYLTYLFTKKKSGH